jgi:signal transduction histidine kinase
MRHLRPRSVTVLAALAAGVFTDIVMTVHSVQYAYRSIAVHAMLEVTATLIAFVTTVLLWGRLRYRRGLDDLLLFVAIGFLSVTSLLFAVIPAAIWREPHPFSTWTTLIAGGLTAAVLAVAAHVRSVRIRNYERAGRIAVVVMTVALLAIGTVVGAYVERLPVGIDPSRSPLNIPGPISGNWAIAGVQLTIAVLFLIAAIGFTRRAEVTSDEFFLWLGAGAVFAAFARLNYVVFPSLYSEWVYTGDILRFGWHLLLLIGAVREIRVYQRAYAEARVLEERRRIARDLHDGLAQELAFIANKTRELSGGAASVSRTALRQVASAAQRGLDESRRAIQTLTTDDDEPFEIVLVQTVEEVADRLGANVQIEAEPAPEITADQREQLLRIVREAVTNAACHAHADLVRVQFTNGGRPMHLRVEDDGIGFDPDDTDGGFGLVTMRERALAIGAEFNVNSTRGRGTAVEVRL